MMRKLLLLGSILGAGLLPVSALAQDEPSETAVADGEADESESAGNTCTFELGNGGNIVAGVDTRIESSRWLSLDFLDLGQQNSYMMSNARLTYEAPNERYAITAFINNIENELVFSNSLQSPAKAGVI